MIAVIGVGGIELDGLLATEAEQSLQFQGKSHEDVPNPLEGIPVQFLGTALPADMGAFTDAVVVVPAGHDIPLVDLLGPPAQNRHAVLHRADGQFT